MRPEAWIPAWIWVAPIPREHAVPKTVAKNALLTIYEGDLGLGGTGGCVARVKGNETRLIAKLAHFRPHNLVVDAAHGFTPYCF